MKQSIKVGAACSIVSASIATLVTSLIWKRRVDSLNDIIDECVNKEANMTQQIDELTEICEYSTNNDEVEEIRQDAFTRGKEAANAVWEKRLDENMNVDYTSYSRNSEHAEKPPIESFTHKDIPVSENNGQVSSIAIISEFEFGQLEDYEEVGLTLFSDNVLADDYDEVVDIAGSIGKAAVTELITGDSDVIFVRNTEYMIDYCVTKDERTYKEITNDNEDNYVDDDPFMD